MSNTLEVGKKLVDLCRAGKTMDAVNSLYATNIVSEEAQASPSMPQRMEGIAAVRGKDEWWVNNHEIHKVEADGPWPHGDRFIVRFHFEVTPKAGPMTGKRMNLDEAALYTVKDGKIVREEFFYQM
jgi:ketosteroid isomerase-like protein